MSIQDPCGAVVFWDYQVGTFTGQLGAAKVGNYAGELLTVDALQTALGVALAATTGAQLQADMLAAPYEGNKTFISKTKVFGLFTQAQLRALYTAGESNIDIKIFLKQFDNGPDPTELTSPEWIAGITALGQAGIITPPSEVDRILKGIAA